MKHNIKTWMIGCVSITCMLAGNVFAADAVKVPSELPMKPAPFAAAASVKITPQPVSLAESAALPQQKNDVTSASVQNTSSQEPR